MPRRQGPRRLAGEPGELGGGGLEGETQARGSQRRRNERTLIIEKLALSDDFSVGLKRKRTKPA